MYTINNVKISIKDHESGFRATVESSDPESLIFELLHLMDCNNKETGVKEIVQKIKDRYKID